MRISCWIPYGLNCRDDSILIEFAADIFITCQKIIIRKTLKNEPRYSSYADGREIQESIEPTWSGFAFYWLEGSGFRPAFEMLERQGIMERDIKGFGPVGYGCDELYGFTALGTTLLLQHKESKCLADHLRRLLETRHLPVVKLDDSDTFL